MAKKRKKYNIKKEATRQRRFLRDLKIPEGQVRQRLLKQEDKELVLDQYSPIVNKDSDERVIDTESKFDKLNHKKRFEDTNFGDAIVRQRKSRRGFFWKRRHSIREKIDVVECHIYDPDGNLLRSTFAQKGEHWNYVNENEKSYETYESGNFTGREKRYDRIVLEPNKILRSNGFKRGKYSVHFNFHRNRLGSDHIFYIDTEADNGGATRSVIVNSRQITKTKDGDILRRLTRGKKPYKPKVYLKEYQKKLFIQEISPSRTEIRALPVSSFTNIINNKFRKEFVGKKRNFELFDRQNKIIDTEETGVFLTVDTYPESKKKGYEQRPGEALVTISKGPTATKDDVSKLFEFTPDMVGGVLTIPRRGISGVNNFDLYSDFEAEIVEYIDEHTIRVGSEFRQPTPIGDVNLDNYVNMLDFDKLFSVIKGDESLSGVAQYQADLDQDGKIDLADALWTLRIAIQEVKKIGYTRQGDEIIGQGVLTADRIFGVANDILANYKMTAAQRTIFDINRDGRINTLDLLRFLENDVIDVVTEITEVLRRPFKIEYENPYYDERKSLKYLLNFGDNERYLLTNWERDDVTYPEYPHSLIFKLYEPLPKSVKQKQYFHIVEEITPSVIEEVVLTGKVEPQANRALRPPDWDNVDTKYVGKTEPIDLSSWDNLLTTSSVTSQQLVDRYFSGSFDSTNLNIDYKDYNNFVFFGSARERLENFKYKLQLLEGYSSSISLESTISGSTTSVASYQQKQLDLINGFDGYEKFLYFESGSHYTSSYGNFRNKTWPKTSTGSFVNEPYILSKVNSNAAMTWFDEQAESASRYDKNNPNSLMNSLPTHISQNNDNDEFFLFLDMIGQHYDTLWTYTNHLTQVTRRKERTDEGVPRDLVYQVVKSMGHQLDLGTNVLDLWEYTLGSDETGSFKYENKQSYEDISKETWRRIGNNLPYILKHKGTLRGIKALLSCYGVPQTILKIKEYGGPLLYESETDTEIERYRKEAFTDDDSFVYSVGYSGSQFISGSWDNLTTSSRYPDTIEFMFKTNNLDWANPKQSMFSVGNGWSIYHSISGSGGGSKKGYINFALSGSGTTTVISSSATSIYDNNFYNVMVRRNSGSDDPGIEQTYELFVKKFDPEFGRITFNSSASLTTNDVELNNSWTGSGVLSDTSSSFYLGGSGSFSDYPNFIGNILEHRQWVNPLTEKAFENHTIAPQSYNGNKFYSSYDDMILRWKLDTQQNYSTTKTISDTKPNQENVSPNTLKAGHAHNFGSTDYSETYLVNRMVATNAGPNRRLDNKVRIENNSLYYGNLSVNRRSELSSYDTAPLDSPRLGVYLSPQEVINDDIMRTFGDLDFDSLIGDPRHQYKNNYPDLELARYLYFRKFGGTDPIKLSDYMDIVRLYDLSLFAQIERLVPARTKLATGVLIEPHILERPKVKWEKPSYENTSYSGSMEPEPTLEESEFIQEEGEMSPDPQVIGETKDIQGTTPRPVETEGEETTYEGEMDKPTVLDGEKTDYEGDAIDDTSLTTSGEKTDYEGKPIPDSSLTLDGEKTDYEGPAIDDSALTLEGEKTDYEGKPISDSSLTVEGTEDLYDGKPIVDGGNPDIEGEKTDYEGLLDGENEPMTIEGLTKLLNGDIEKPDIYTINGKTTNIEGTWFNPHKNVASEYNKKVWVYELAASSSYANYTSSMWEGFELVPKVVYTMEGAKFPSQFPNVEGNPVHNVQWQTEALLPPYMEGYIPPDGNYWKEKVLLETEFNKGKYASSMKQKVGIGYESIGSQPVYFKSSSITEFRGWNTSSLDGLYYPQYVTTDQDTSPDEEVVIDNNGDYITYGEGTGSEKIPEDQPFVRDGQPAVFEIREFDELDAENRKYNEVNKIQALYVENYHTTSSFSLEYFWGFQNLTPPTNIEWELPGERGFYARFGTRGAFEMKAGDLYKLDFNFVVSTHKDSAGNYTKKRNDERGVTVHLLEGINDDFDVNNLGQAENKWPWKSQLLGKVYKTSGFRKFFTPRRDGNFRIVFVIHGGLDIETEEPQNPFKFYIPRFKLSHMEKADYTPSTKYSTSMRNLFFDGCKQTAQTTTDGLDPVVVTETNPNVLVVDSSGETELDVI